MPGATGRQIPTGGTPIHIDEPDPVLIRRPTGRTSPLIIPPPKMPGWSTRTSPTARAPQEIHFSGSAKGWAIPYVFGSRKLSGQVIGLHTVSDRWMYIVYLLCEGEVSSIANIELNDTAIASVTGYSAHVAHVGAAAQSIDSTLQEAIPNWSDTHNNGLIAVTGRSTGRAYVWVKLDITKAASPGVPTLTAEVARGNVDDWTPTSRATSNPVVALWSYMNERTGLASADIDATSWDAVRAVCDANPGDATAQWSVNLALTGASDGACVQQLLQLFFGSLAWYDGKLYLSSRRTLAAATLTLTDDHIIQPLSWSRTPIHQRPNMVDVIYTDATSWQQQVKTSAAGGINRNSTDCRAIQVHLPGCTDPSMATRYAEQYRKLLTNEVINARFSVNSVGVKLNPGDRVDITTPTGFTAEKFRVDSITALPNGEYVINATAYDSTAQSASTGAADTPPDTVDAPTAPTAPTDIEWLNEYLTYTDEFANETVRRTHTISWTPGAGGLPTVAWAFEIQPNIAATLGTIAVAGKGTSVSSGGVGGVISAGNGAVVVTAPSATITESSESATPSVILRSYDVLSAPDAVRARWSVTESYEADFLKSEPEFPAYTGASRLWRVVAIAANGSETPSAWSTEWASSEGSPESAPLNAEDIELAMDSIATGRLVMTVKNNTGGNLTLHYVCYISGDDAGTPEITLADANSEAECKGMLVMLTAGVDDGETVKAIIKGVNDPYTGLTPGETLYVSANDVGYPTATKPSGSGDVVRIVGHCISPTEIFFDPAQSYDIVP